MTIRISVARANAACDAVVDGLDLGAGAGYVQVRTGAQPATVAAAATGTLLGTLTLSDPAFGSTAGATATANAVTSDTSADNSGTAGWFRAYDSTGTAVMDGSVTATGGGGDMELATVTVSAGDTIAVTSFTVSMPTT